jgi:hypothetical protein
MIFVTVMDFPFFGPKCVNFGGDPTDTHAVVLSGIDTGRNKVSIVNPWGSTVPPVDLDVVIGALQEIADTASHPIAFMR